MYTLDTLPWWGWMVLALTVTAIAGAVVIFFVLRANRTFTPPLHDLACTEHFRLSDAVPFVTVHLYIRNRPWGTSPRASINTSILTRRCALAAACTNAAFQTFGWRVNEVMVYFANEPFEASAWKSVKDAAAFLLTVQNVNGSRTMPMIVVRPRYFDEVLDSGEPIIHEMCHALLQEFSKVGLDRDHGATGIWAQHGPGTRQETARQLFQTFLQDERTRSVQW